VSPLEQEAAIATMQYGLVYDYSGKSGDRLKSGDEIPGNPGKSREIRKSGEIRGQTGRFLIFFPECSVTNSGESNPLFHFFDTRKRG
jgi:hypothetical protein